MFDEKQLSQLDPVYFNIITLDDRDRCDDTESQTGHYWYLHCTECPTESACIIFHKHRFSHPYHQHGRRNSLHLAIKSIKNHDRWQMKYRKEN